MVISILVNYLVVLFTILKYCMPLFFPLLMSFPFCPHFPQTTLFTFSPFLPKTLTLFLKIFASLHSILFSCPFSVSISWHISVFFFSMFLFLSFLVHLLPLSPYLPSHQVFLPLSFILSSKPSQAPHSFSLYSITPFLPVALESESSGKWKITVVVLLGAHLVGPRSWNCPFHFVALKQRIMESR